jgi:hypothetical protein
MSDHTTNPNNPQRAEYGTPPEIVACSKALLSGIDLDPATDAVFNAGLVQASYFYDESSNGLDQPWGGRVWLNPPGGGHGRPRTRLWWEKLVEEYKAHNVSQACYLSFALDSFQWSQSSVSILSFPTFTFAKRLKFWRVVNGQLVQKWPDKDGKIKNCPSKPCALTWLPPHDMSREQIASSIPLFSSLLESAGHKNTATWVL